ncbi:hypothetical protein SNEBB_008546 [Seison nebaliae]|nr:hypothetical protein SNEBB_008546 [Seison nebaliae]
MSEKIKGTIISSSEAKQAEVKCSLKALYELSDDPHRKEFLDDLFSFMQRRGSPVNRIPIMAKQVLDLYELFRLVVSKGGLVEVINKKLWREITKGLNLPSSITSAAFTLRTQYMKYLYPYECERYKLSNSAELQSAIDGNRREARRPSYGYSDYNTAAMAAIMANGLNVTNNNSLKQILPPHAAAAVAQAAVNVNRQLNLPFQSPNLFGLNGQTSMMNAAATAALQSSLMSKPNESKTLNTRSSNFPTDLITTTSTTLRNANTNLNGSCNTICSNSFRDSNLSKDQSKNLLTNSMNNSFTNKNDNSPIQIANRILEFRQTNNNFEIDSNNNNNNNSFDVKSRLSDASTLLSNFIMANRQNNNIQNQLSTLLQSQDGLNSAISNATSMQVNGEKLNDFPPIQLQENETMNLENNNENLRQLFIDSNRDKIHSLIQSLNESSIPTALMAQVNHKEPKSEKIDTDDDDNGSCSDLNNSSQNGFMKGNNNLFPKTRDNSLASPISDKLLDNEEFFENLSNSPTSYLENKLKRKLSMISKKNELKKNKLLVDDEFFNTTCTSGYSSGNNVQKLNGNRRHLSDEVEGNKKNDDISKPSNSFLTANLLKENGERTKTNDEGTMCNALFTYLANMINRQATDGNNDARSCKSNDEEETTSDHSVSPSRKYCEMPTILLDLDTSSNVQNIEITGQLSNNSDQLSMRLQYGSMQFEGILQKKQ